MRKAVGLGKEGGVDVDEAKTPERGEEVARERCGAAMMHVDLCAAVRSDMRGIRLRLGGGRREEDGYSIGKRGHPRGSLAS